MTLAFVILNALWFTLFLYIMRRWTKSVNLAQALRKELDELTTLLYGSPQIYEQAKENRRECRTDREEKVAREAAQKGITRAAKQYPSRFKGTRI
ncbi:hypothetical protein SD70_27240 [Gordoniibacillus kamchatkensis]|uniref:Uncharacterized protein n=1 Tax=Gordoniibacillus kamchatkensis TaxID=1590651 RepID=A0ABR5ACA7_9BACL|nr:hypothetical protein [Paenibacillus sp. VKM B-2647]KIL38313.1 hypothetical protein SD70_27240 [Paenibacillus sp. VKM B-2647]